MNLTLAGALLALAVWVTFAFVVPVGAGWIHLFLGLGMALLARRVVTGREAR